MVFPFRGMAARFRALLAEPIGHGWTRVDRIKKVRLTDGSLASGSLFARRVKGQIQYRAESAAERLERLENAPM